MQVALPWDGWGLGWFTTTQSDGRTLAMVWHGMLWIICVSAFAVAEQFVMHNFCDDLGLMGHPWLLDFLILAFVTSRWGTVGIRGPCSFEPIPTNVS